MRQSLAKSQDGQALIYVAIGLVALLLMAAIAIDVGHLYSERRRMQNAADAGALAGARELCLGHGQTQAEAVAVQYATTQNAGPYGQTAVASANMTSYIVTVTTNELPASFLAGGLGLAPANVGAVAKAACGPVNTACGLFPLAFDLSQWNQVKGSCGRHFYVWTGEKADAGPDCTSCDCDTDGDGQANIFSGVGRAWLDMSSALNPLYPAVCLVSGCGANEIKCWINNLQPAPITIPNCISGDSGKKAGIKNAVDDRAAKPYPDNIVKVPLFAGTCSGTSCSGGFSVTTLGCVQVIGWVQNLTLNKSLPGKTCTTWKDAVIEVAVSCDKAACEDKCGHTTGGPCTGGSEVCAVNLVQ